MTCRKHCKHRVWLGQTVTSKCSGVLCGHDGLVRPLKRKHFSGGALCKGTPIELVYKLQD